MTLSKGRSVLEWEVRYFKETVWDKLSASSRYVDPEIGLARVAEGGYAYHSTPEVAYHYIDSHWDDQAICDSTEIHVITPRILGFWERIDSPFNEIIKIGYIRKLKSIHNTTRFFKSLSLDILLGYPSSERHLKGSSFLAFRPT